MQGKKIEMYKVLNREISVHDYLIGPSKYEQKGNGKCLKLQIEFENEKRVVFTGSVILQEMIQQVNRTDFPFSTTIKKEEERFFFT